MKRALLALLFAPAIALAQSLPSPVFKQMQVTDGVNTTTYTGAACSGPGCSTGASLNTANVFTQPQTMPSLIVTDGNGTGTYTPNAYSLSGVHYPGWTTPQVLQYTGSASTMLNWGLRCNRLPTSGAGAGGGSTAKCYWGYGQTYELDPEYQWEVAGEVHNYSIGSVTGAQNAGTTASAFVEIPRIAVVVSAVTGNGSNATYTYTGAYAIASGDAVIVSGTGVGADCTGSGTPACLVTGVASGQFTIASTYNGSASGLSASATDVSVSQTFGGYNQVVVNTPENNPKYQQLNETCDINLTDPGGPTTDSKGHRIGCSGSLHGGTGDHAFAFLFGGTKLTVGAGIGPTWDNFAYMNGNYAQGLNATGASTGIPVLNAQANQYLVFDGPASVPSSNTPWAGRCTGGDGSSRCFYYNGALIGYYTPSVTGGAAFSIDDSGNLRHAGNLPVVDLDCVAGSLDVTAAINAALTGNNAVHLMNSPCVISDSLNQGLQALYGDGWGLTKIQMAANFNPAAAGGIVLSGTGVGAVDRDFSIIGAQPSFVSTTAASTVASGTSITVNSKAGLAVGDYLLDNTNSGAIPFLDAIVSISGGSAPYTIVLTSGVTGVQNGDSLTGTFPKSAFLALGSCDGVTTPCKYPPFITINPTTGATGNRMDIERVNFTGAWSCLDLQQGGPGTTLTASFAGGATSISVASGAALTVGRTLADFNAPAAIDSTTTISSITGTGPYTVNLSIPTTGASNGSGDTIYMTANVAPWISHIECGGMYRGLTLDGPKDDVHVDSWDQWSGWGWPQSQAWTDGQGAAWYLGRVDGFHGTGNKFFEMGVTLVPNNLNSATSTLVSNSSFDGRGSNIYVYNAKNFSLENIHKDGTSNISGQSPVTVVQGLVQFTEPHLYDTAASNSISTGTNVPVISTGTGSTVLLLGGYTQMQSTAQPVMCVNGGNGSVSNMFFTLPASGLNTPVLCQTAGGLKATGNYATTAPSQGASAAFVSIGADTAANFVDGNYSPGLASVFPQGASLNGFYATPLVRAQPANDSTSLGIGPAALSSYATAVANFHNTAVGVNAMSGAMTGNAGGTGANDAAFGFNALAAVTTGNNNTAMGSGAGAKINSGLGNTAVGELAANAVTGGNNNTAVGMGAMNNSTGSTNTVLGQGSLSAATSGNSNTIVGAELANSVCITCDHNVIIGYGAQGLDTAASNTSYTLNLAGVMQATGTNVPSTSTLTFPALGSVAGSVLYQNGSGNTVALAPGTANQALEMNSGANGLHWVTLGAGSGTVTSVALADGSTTPIYSISGSPITASGTLTETLATQSANMVFAGPGSGSAAQPTFRSLVVADVPTLNQNTSGNAATATLATTGTNIAGGAAGSMPYQTGSGATSQLAVGTAGQVLDVNAGATAPQWVAQSTLAVGTATNLAGGAAGSLPQQTGSGATSLLALGTAGQYPAVNAGATALAYSTPTYDVMFASASISSGVTDYLAPGVFNTSNTAGALCPRALHFTSLYFTQTTAAATTGTTVTLYVGTAGSALSSTTLTCTTGATGKTCSDTSHTVACTAGQGWSVQENVAGTEANTGLNMYGLTYTVP